MPPKARVTEAVRARAREAIERLLAEFPNARTALDYATPYQLLIATILSAQCTDERVNKTTPALFAAAPDAPSMLGLGLERVRELIRSINFFNNKARNILGASERLMELHGGEVPDELASLVALPGVGRKTANVVLNEAFGKGGIVVDTHVRRVANRLGLVRRADPVHVEADLEGVIPREHWTRIAHLFILHGRKTCKALRPLCGECPLEDLCPSSGKKANAWKDRLKI